MNKKGNWYIVKNSEGNCQIIENWHEQLSEDLKFWGPFISNEEAIAHRVGLIRAGKCQPQ